MAEDPFGRKDDDQDPFGQPSGGLSSGDPLAGWAPPSAGEAGPVPPSPGPPPQPTWAPPTAGAGHTGPVGGGVGGQSAPTNGKATAALVLGILGLPFFCPILCSIPALVLGYQARKEIDASGGVQQGRGQAQAGVVMGWIGTVVGVLAIVVIVILAATGNLDDTSDGDDVFAVLRASLLR